MLCQNNRPCHSRPLPRAIQTLVRELRHCWAKLDGRAETIRRLQADHNTIEQRAIEQSECIQQHWISPAEATGMRREIARLQALLQHATK